MTPAERGPGQVVDEDGGSDPGGQRHADRGQGEERFRRGPGSSSPPLTRHEREPEPDEYQGPGPHDEGQPAGAGGDEGQAGQDEEGEGGPTVPGRAGGET